MILIINKFLEIYMLIIHNRFYKIIHNTYKTKINIQIGLEIMWTLKEYNHKLMIHIL